MVHRLLAVLGLFALSVAFAQNPHYVVSPDCTLSGTTVTCTGSIAGLGQWDVTARLTVEASVTVICTNRGGNVAPGQTKYFSSTTTQTELRPENGRLNFSISATADPLPPLSARDCPNRHWTPSYGDVTVHSALLEFFQRGNQLHNLTYSETF